MGAMAIFSEKYGDVVRVIQIGDYSRELCGGTHLNSTGQAGLFRMISEGSTAAGIRRIEAVTGAVAAAQMQADRRREEKLRNLLQCRSEAIETRVEELLEQKKMLERQLGYLKQQLSQGEVDQFAAAAKETAGVKFVAQKVTAVDVNELKSMSDGLRESLQSGVGVLAAEINGKVSFVCIVTDDLIQEKKLRAGDLIKKIAAQAGATGGGRPHMALAGGKDAGKIETALAAVPEIIQDALG